MHIHGSPHIPHLVIMSCVFVANETANVSVKVSEENRPENKTAFYAGGNITINASAVLFEVEELESSLTPSRSGWYYVVLFPCLELSMFCNETVVQWILP